jgi:hypothetical protein
MHCRQKACHEKLFSQPKRGIGVGQHNAFAGAPLQSLFDATKIKASTFGFIIRNTLVKRIL